LPYAGYFGGVSGLSKKQFLKINGFPNEYWGWGGEDDDIYNRTFSCVHPRLSAELIPPPPSSFTSTPGFLAPWPPIHHQCRIRGKTSLNLSLTNDHLTSCHSQHSCLPPRSERQRNNPCNFTSLKVF
ncbi:hypothetical protein ATANTOWER_016415, partial [Ataeniobius toweri]|nr:hypothetical protein [Ataeniobius toweri]